MENLQEQQPQETSLVQDEEVTLELEGDSLVEELLRSVIKGYQESFNKHNPKHEVNFSITITNHKITTPEGNKDVAYLRLDRGIRPKGTQDNYDIMLVHQEVYFFRNMQERLNPDKPWVEQLFLNCLARLLAGGLEYAELLRRMKQPKVAPQTEEQVQEERLAKLGLVQAKSLPAPLSAEDQAYKEWLANERVKEGLNGTSN